MADGTTVKSEAHEMVLRLHAERAEIQRRVRALGTVRASSVTSLREQEIVEDLAREQVEIVRVPIGRQVDACPPIRLEGETTILSIVEEVVVIERRLMLTEEVHMTKLRKIDTHRETVTLRQQHAVIVREPSP